MSKEQLNNINNDNEDEDVIDDSIEQFLDEDGMGNYQDNDNNNEHINGRRNGRRILIDEEKNIHG